MCEQTFWLRRARREALRFNLGWWLQRFLPWVLTAGLLAALGLLTLRSAGLAVPGVAVGVVVFLLAGAVVSGIWSRKNFLTQAEALARLDADLGLKNRLTSAAHGVGPWPPPRPGAAFNLRWRWGSLLWPPAVAGLLGLAALVVPLPEATARKSAAAAEPPSWTATRQKLETLTRDALVQREAVEELETALEALRRQPSDQWFRHESLEAGDHLQTQLDQSLAELQKHLETALGALEAARQLEETQLAALGQPLDAALDQALSGMELGKLPLSDEMMAKLRPLDASKMRQLSTEEWKALSERLKNGIGTCSGGTCSGDKAGEGLIALILSQQGGGPGRGPGNAPLTLKPEETRLGTTHTEAVSNDDLSRAAVGDLMGLGTGSHQVDEDAWSGPQDGGRMVSPGRGGEAVWQQGATPPEQQALRRFFQ